MEKERVEGLTFLRPKNPIPKAELVVGAYYSGVCRNASVARWDGKEFWYLRSKFRHLFIEPICHRDDDEHYDVFDAEYRLEGDELAEAKPIEFPVKH